MVAEDEAGAEADAFVPFLVALLGPSSRFALVFLVGKHMRYIVDAINREPVWSGADDGTHCDGFVFILARAGAAPEQMTWVPPSLTSSFFSLLPTVYTVRPRTMPDNRSSDADDPPHGGP